MSERSFVKTAKNTEFRKGQIWTTRKGEEHLVLVLSGVSNFIDQHDLEGQVRAVALTSFPTKVRAYRPDGRLNRHCNEADDLMRCVGHIEMPAFVAYELEFVERVNSCTQMLSSFPGPEVQSDLAGSSTQTQSDTTLDRAVLAKDILLHIVDGVTETVAHTYAKGYAKAAVLVADALLAELAKERA
ncbi:hypothetical protein D3C71_1240150 [compost metagenome]